MNFAKHAQNGHGIGRAICAYGESILIVRLGAMGDIIHTLPAAASLKQSFPRKKFIWAVRPKWRPLLEGNPFIDELVPVESPGIDAMRDAFRRLSPLKPSLAIDFQGLIQSAVVGRLSRPSQLWGFHKSIAREPLASWLYNRTAMPPGPHRVERNLQLAQAAGATTLTGQAWLPEGFQEGALPSTPFVLCSPFAGWAGKQWPLEYHDRLATALSKEGITLVANITQADAPELSNLRNLHVHSSSIPGLISATRQALAVVGVDSGPMHLAAALGKPGVAVFGPTDPDANGPYGGTLSVLRADRVETTYARDSTIHPSMRAITPDQVFAALMRSLDQKHASLVQPS